MSDDPNFEPPVIIGKRMAIARRNAKLSQTELANLCGIHQSHVSGIERGARAPSIDVAKAVSVALGVSVHWLIGGESCATLAVQDIGTEHLLSDSKTPAGLAALAGDEAQVKSLKIRSAEWVALRALTPPLPLTKEGYLAVLLAFRGHAERH